ncbi:MAG: LemA family protein [Candidatus Diapherotrites archaeon]|nr:LemA family protein [Candidatus Diapherotrites archaeon]
MWIILGAILLVLVVAAIALVMMYNSFISLKTQMENSLAQIDVQTKRRFDLVPNLVETVKGYAKHEKSTLTEVTKARAAISKAGSPGEKMAAENLLSGALKTLFAVSENYPKLLANQNFLMLQEELAGIEGKIAYARQFYNDAIMRWNKKVQSFPSNVIAGVFGFKAQEHLEATAAERKAVKVKF